MSCPQASAINLSPEEAKIMLVEPKGVVNTGDEVNELTAEDDQWI